MTIPAPLRRLGWPAALALLLLVGGLVETAVNDYARGDRPLIAVISVLIAVPFVVAGRAPALTTGAVMAAVGIAAAMLPEDTFNNLVAGYLGFLAASYVAGTAREWRLAVAGLALSVGGAAAVTTILGEPVGIISTTLVAGAVWTAAFLITRRTAQTRELRERAAMLEREREIEARAAVAEERARIAREMHDVVAHSLSVMVVQAEAAEAMLDVDPERARRPLGAVQETGREALAELRAMLGVLREMADEAPELAPQPGLSGVGELVAHVREAGLPVTLRVEGSPRPLSPGADLSAYRIVQEGLTNALKHAGPATAEVLLRYGDRDVELVVSDDGRGPAAANGSPGHGLIGMRERVVCYGGELDAGPREGGGFRLAARLPIEPMAGP
ncbi:sensor histidine kinase [Miltoncostaea marina]|uniref:sensor histidine kinase n=1 Tax=Miltoncostaea marina TaxID=2843215 RepID=UPI001C3D4AE5|nr:sensor histidine kinase [Miltoncostaea marina]